MHMPHATAMRSDPTTIPKAAPTRSAAHVPAIGFEYEGLCMQESIRGRSPSSNSHVTTQRQDTSAGLV